MRKARSGRFIAVGSKAAERAHANLGAYVIFKSALVTFVQTLAIENAPFGITSNVVLPGTMDTPGNRAAMPNVDPRTWVSPGDVANAIYWLASNEASQVNGAAIPVSGPDV
jgi:NAD(P)-dependent dehydrogenase (short-subunit alcohol dehydrogenase family)